MDSKVQGSAATINAKKAVRGNSKGRAQLLEQVFAAASRLLGKRTAPPEIRIVGGTEQRAPLGKAFALDGSPTVDPDADAIVFQWRGPEGIDFQQEGAQIRFTPTVPGKYKFTLKVSKLLDAKASRERDVEVVVMAPPEVRVEENALLEMRGRTPVTLRGECDACEQWQWTQLSGPVTTVPAECSGTGSAAVCKVWAEAPGLYSFSLSGSNAIGRDSKEGTFGVAPVPVALIDIPTNAVVNHSYDFTGTASHDVFGGSLRFHWEVSKTPFPKVGCAPRYLAAEESVPSAPAGVWLSAPTEATTEFVATQPVDYHVRLTVQAERKFGSRSSSTQQCTSRRISVERPVWWPSIQAGGDFASHDGWSQPWEGFRLKVALNVHPTWLPDWLGLRFAQTIARKDQSSDRFKYLGGTWVGLTAMPSAVFQPYLSSYVRTWEDFALGLEAGIEFRVQRLLVFGASARMEHRSDGWRFPVLGAYMGAGYDL